MELGVWHNLRRWANGDPLAFRTLVPSDEQLGKLRAVQINAAIRNSAPMMLANMANAIVLQIAMWETPRQTALQTWGFLIVAMSSYLLLRQRGRRRSKRPSQSSLRGIRHATINGLVLCLLWGMAPAFFFFGATSGQQLVIACLAIGMLCGGAFALSTIPVAAVAFTTPIVLGSAYACLGAGTLAYWCLAMLLAVYSFVLFWAVSAHAQQLAMRVLDHARDEAAAQTDALTRLPNRVSFQRHLTETLARLRRYGEGFGVFCFDLDHFKPINDTLGHASGDRVLADVAQRLRLTTRDVDTVARLAGDEFAIIAAHIETEEQAIVLAERINRAFEEPFQIDDQSFTCTISIGIALAPQDGRDADILMRHADAALYATKHRQRGTYTFYRDKAAAPAVTRADDTQVRRALADRELQLFFQPLVEVATRRTKGFEAILRWNHPERGLVLGSEIVTLAEQTGYIEQVGSWALREAIRIARDWPKHLRLAINVSSLQLRGSMLERTLLELTEDGRFDPARIELQVDESALTGDAAAIETLHALRQRGVRVALDDFGAGFASVTNLPDLPVDRLKVDRSFVRNMLAAPACGSLVRALAMLARDLNLAMTAEGVETPEQIAFLQSVGCVEAQGRAFSRPVVADELVAMYESCGPAEVVDMRARLKVV